VLQIKRDFSSAEIIALWVLPLMSGQRNLKHEIKLVQGVFLFRFETFGGERQSFWQE
jgi:hypothetical protein